MSHEAALREEVVFWQSLIERQGTDVPAEVLERMQQAQALAERRLARAEAKSQSSH